MNKKDIRFLIEQQDKLNTLIDDDWKNNRIKEDFIRAMVVEVGELIDWTGYKWWAKQRTYEDQAQLELADIWFFFISLYILEEIHYDGLNFVDDLEAQIELSSMMDQTLPGGSTKPTCFDRIGVHKKSLEFLHEITIGIEFSMLSTMKSLVDLSIACGVSAETLNKLYLSKLILNIFRQENGYKSGDYVKMWEPKHLDHAVEDNMVLEYIMKTTNDPSEIRAKLEEAYKTT